MIIRIPVQSRKLEQRWILQCEPHLLLERLLETWLFEELALPVPNRSVVAQPANGGQYAIVPLQDVVTEVQLQARCSAVHIRKHRTRWSDRRVTLGEREIGKLDRAHRVG